MKDLGKIFDKQKKHVDNCSAPICALDFNMNFKNEVVWIPTEPVCRHKPYEKFQLQQLKINDLVRQRRFKIKRYYTANDLVKLGNIKGLKKKMKI